MTVPIKENRFIDNHSYRAIGKTYLLKLVDNARSARNEDRSEEINLLGAGSLGRGAEKDDRSVESLIEFIEGGTEKKQKRKKKKSSLAGNAEGDAGVGLGGRAVAEQIQGTLEPFHERLSEVSEDSGVHAPSENPLGLTAAITLQKTKLKKPKKKSKQSGLKSADENKSHGTNDDVIGSSEIVGREDVEAEEKPLEDTGEPLSYLTRELAAKEAELHELLESEVHFVESKGKEMSSLLLSVDEFEDEKHNVDKKVAEIDAQMAELQIRKDQLVKYKEDKGRKLEKLLKKKNKLENFIEEKVREQKETKRRLEKEIEEIKAKFTETQRASESEAQPESLKLLVDYINGQIESKEEELECPVCLTVVSAPLFCCEDQHLICADCRPKVDALLV